jgi:hypothetical protein
MSDSLLNSQVCKEALQIKSKFTVNLNFLALTNFSLVFNYYRYCHRSISKLSHVKIVIPDTDHRSLPSGGTTFQVKRKAK